jgi:hypothetical protein
MENRLLIGFALVIFTLSACSPAVTPTTPPVGAKPTKEMTSEDYAMQTIIAREQIAETPTLTPTEFTNLPKPWTEIATPTSASVEPIPESTPSFQTTVIAIAPLQNSIIYQGPGFNNKMACYVQEGTQLIVTGQTANSAWLQVSLGPDQSCVTMVGNIIIESVRRDLNMQFWVSSSTYNISGNLSEVPIIFQ